jgi:hypothetical protein
MASRTLRLAVLLALAGGAGLPGAEVRRELFLASPGPGTAVLAATYYTRPTGRELLSLHQLMSRSDTVDVAFLRHSADHGRTWSAATGVPTLESRPDGRLRRALRGGVADPVTGRFVRFYLEALLPTDDPLEGMRRWQVSYAVSGDGGRTWDVDEPVVHRGEGFSRAHPLPGVEIGRNAFMVGDLASVPLVLVDGTILVPVMITPQGPDGTYHNPGGGYTYSDAAALRGRWRPDGRIDWEISALIRGDPARSTRGLDEPTFAPLAEGRLLAVLRGSNGGKPTLPARRWAAWSEDGGRTWTEATPWTYADGGDFFSPSACSQLVPHSSGRLYWIGNLTPANPDGNRPRYPLVVGEVDRRSGLLRRETVRVVDTRGPGDSAQLTLSNFAAREDRETGELVINLSRLFQHSPADGLDWTSDAYLYRVPAS